MKNKKTTSQLLSNILIVLIGAIIFAGPTLLRSLPHINFAYEFYRIRHYFTASSSSIKVLFMVLLPFVVVYFFQKREIALIEKETALTEAEHLCRTHTSEPRRDFLRNEQPKSGNFLQQRNTSDHTLQNSGYSQPRRKK